MANSGPDSNRSSFFISFSAVNIFFAERSLLLLHVDELVG